MSQLTDALTRRDFILSTLRIGAVSGLLSTGVYLGLRKGSGEDASCTDNFVCHTCSRKKKCELPEAIHSRKNEKQSIGNESQYE